jgi:hypothetical protein
MFQFMLAARPWARIFFCGGVAPFGYGLDTPAASGNEDTASQTNMIVAISNGAIGPPPIPASTPGNNRTRQGLAQPQALNTKAASVAANI